MIKGICIILFALSLIIMGGLTFPSAKEIFEVKEDIEYQERVVENKKEYIEKMHDLSSTRSDYLDKIGKTAVTLPDNPEVPAILSHIENMARENDMIIVNLANFQIEEDDTTVFFDKINFNFTVKGSYPSFRDLLSKIEENERIFQVNSIQIEEDEWLNLFSVNLSAYYYTE